MTALTRVALLSGLIFTSLSLQAFQKIDPKKEKNDIVVPKGFKVQILETDLGKIRHLTVSDNGIIYLNRSKLGEDGSSLLMLQDSNKDGQIDNKLSFGKLPGTALKSKTTIFIPPQTQPYSDIN